MKQESPLSSSFFDVEMHNLLTWLHLLWTVDNAQLNTFFELIVGVKYNWCLLILQLSHFTFTFPIELNLLDSLIPRSDLSSTLDNYAIHFFLSIYGTRIKNKELRHSDCTTSIDCCSYHSIIGCMWWLCFLILSDFPGGKRFWLKSSHAGVFINKLRQLGNIYFEKNYKLKPQMTQFQVFHGSVFHLSPSVHGIRQTLFQGLTTSHHLITSVVFGRLTKMTKVPEYQ